MVAAAKPISIQAQIARNLAKALIAYSRPSKCKLSPRLRDTRPRILKSKKEKKSPSLCSFRFRLVAPDLHSHFHPGLVYE
ncbi:hypothetical protein Tco_0822204 [Tanacetum coccineum]|uniref:Uncharacterized protein n=1 Tax=Tanacetum coccineum TaxID=301880 RepID=A0ABQ5AEH4_9ASTR